MKTLVLSFVRVCVILALLLTLALSGRPLAAAQALTGTAALTAPDPATLIVVQNVGQFAGEVLFQVRGRDLTLWLAEDALWLTVFDPSGGSAMDTASLPRAGVNVKLTFPGSNPHPRLEPFDPLETRVSFFTGGDPARWRSDVPAWCGVRYIDLYPGIDLELTSEQGELMPRLDVRPGAELSAVRLRVEGVGAVAVEGDTLRLGAAAGGGYAWPLFRAQNPTGQATVRSAGALTFDVTSPFTRAQHDRLAVHNPQAHIENLDSLSYATYLGGGTIDRGFGVAVDGSGAAYVAGETASADFPTTPGAFNTSFNGDSLDAFVVKLNATGSGLDYAAFLGGGAADYAVGIAVDGEGRAYVTGSTTSHDFPTTPGAFDTHYNGGETGDAFVARLNPTGTALGYATFLGGADAGDWGAGIAVDESGSAYVTGWTASADFPATSGAFDTGYNGDQSGDAFVARLSEGGSALDYATFLGGSGFGGDWGYGIAVDAGGTAYVVGHTYSSDFPTTPGALDASLNGGADSFVATLNAAGSTLQHATFLGGSGDDYGYGIAVDVNGSAYVTGKTSSVDLPTTPGAFDTTLDGWDAFVTRLDLDDPALVYGTFVGGSGYESAMSIAVDWTGAAYVTGQTGSFDFPTTPDAFDTSFDGDYYDAFVLKLNTAGSAPDYATFLGGSRHDGGFGVAVDGARAAYVTGSTLSFDFPAIPGAFDTTFNGGVADAFVVKLAIPILYNYTVYLPLTIQTR